MFLEIVEQPALEPVTLDEAKEHCRVYGTDDDVYLTALITAARQTAEAFLNRAICTQTIRLTMDSFPLDGYSPEAVSFCGQISLPLAPVQSVSTIRYNDVNGDAQTFSDYQTSLGPYVAVVSPAPGESWPETEAGALDSVTVDYVAGFGLPSDSPDLIPQAIKHAILLKVAELYENREENIVGTIVSKLSNTQELLLNPYRISLT